ncbi:MAG: hypothetical protein NVS9B15_20630 [Acidobacteriaceae bacterium]
MHGGTEYPIEGAGMNAALAEQIAQLPGPNKSQLLPIWTENGNGKKGSYQGS